MFRKSEKFAARVSLTMNKAEVSEYQQPINSIDEESKQPRKDTNSKPSWVDNMTPFVLMIGLGVHATFEGLALGMSEDFDGTLLFAIAIILHKGAAGMSLGISMTQTFQNQDSFITKLLVLFAIFTPLGVGIGWALQSSSPMTEIVFSSLAAGSFLYIACSEVIVEEFSISMNRYLKLFAFLFGVAIITGLLFIEGEEHSH